MSILRGRKEMGALETAGKLPWGGEGQPEWGTGADCRFPEMPAREEEEVMLRLAHQSST